MKPLNNYIREEINNDKTALYKDFIGIVRIISNYIIENKLIVYGGTAINEYLPQNEKIYKNNDIPDLDCLSTNAVKHILKIADLLFIAGYRYVKIMSAEHENTYRLSINFKFILDISEIPKPLYKKFIEESNNNKISKKSQYVLAPLTVAIGDLYWEMASPVASLFRWEKILKRLELMTKHFGIEKPNLEEYVNDININNKDIDLALSFVKKEKYPIMRLTALKCHMNKPLNDDVVSILSTSIEKTINDFVSLIDVERTITIVETKTIFERIPNYKTISIDGKKVLQIYDANSICIAITKIKGYSVCVAFGILSFLYFERLFNPKMNKILESYIYNFEKYVKTHKKDVKKIINTKCYGKQKKRLARLAEMWEDEPRIIYKSKCT